MARPRLNETALRRPAVSLRLNDGELEELLRRAA